MALVGSGNSIDADKKAALEISRNLNSNPSRASTARLESHQLGQVDSHQPVHELQSTAYHLVLPDQSQSLTSPIPYSKRPRGLTTITIGEADEKSVPPPGPELLKVVSDAKFQGQVPKLTDSNVVRCVDGLWMAPQICDSCQGISGEKRHNRRLACDRHFPCSSCIATGSECQRGQNMTLIGVSIHTKQPEAPKIFKSSLGDCDFTSVPQMNQNLDSTWNLTAQGMPFFHHNTHDLDSESLVAKQPRRTSGRLAALRSGDKPPFKLVKAYDGGPPERAQSSFSVTPSPVLATNSRGRKRKFDSNENSAFESSINSTAAAELEQLPIESQISSNHQLRKRRTTIKKDVELVRYHQSMQEDKKAPYGKPPVWADKRQSLCEALPYYRAYQSGAYMHKGTVRGFMCDKEVGPRDKFDEEVLIARVGGGRSVNEQGGPMIQKSDQQKSFIGLSFERTKFLCQPVALIAGQGNKISPSKLPHYYNVLDWYHVTDVWCERSGGFKCWMVRLEKINLNLKSWWAAIDSPPLDPNRDIHAIKTTTRGCTSCENMSKEIYNAGWACLNSSCDSYFDFKKEVDDALLDYNEQFIKERTEFPGVISDSLVPPLLTNRDIEMDNLFGVERICKTGIVCPLCKGCSRRIEWDHWQCETPGCPFIHRVRQDVMTVHDAIATGFKLADEYFNERCGIKFKQYTLGMYDVFEYSLPGPQKDKMVGIIRHFRANGIINGQPDGPNDLFRLMQTGQFGLKRHPARQKGSTGEILTSHWAANWGAPYKYGVSVNSKPFEEAPIVIIKALKRLTWAGEQTVDAQLEPFHPFNELLSLGYFEDTSIGYHDDGEKELGPTVATLSLGSQAVMTIRPKAKSLIGEESTNARGSKKDVLKLTLLHGDMVVMHGPGIQQFYEHAVTPNGKLRFALTCRYVRPELMANDEERRHTEINAKLPDGHEKYKYDGDLNNQLVQVDDGPQHVSAAQSAMNQLAGRVLAGELDIGTLRQCQEFLRDTIERMGY